MLDEKTEVESRDTAGLAICADPVAAPPSRAIRRALEFIHANIERDLRLPQIAAAANQSVFHFSRTFRRWTGVTPHEYLTQLRVRRVKALLHDSDKSLAAIADASGFADQSHMSKVFRRYTGTTPKAFRMSRTANSWASSGAAWECMCLQAAIGADDTWAAGLNGGNAGAPGPGAECARRRRRAGRTG